MFSDGFALAATAIFALAGATAAVGFVVWLHRRLIGGMWGIDEDRVATALFGGFLLFPIGWLPIFALLWWMESWWPSFNWSEGLNIGFPVMAATFLVVSVTLAVATIPGDWRYRDRKSK